MILEIPVQYIYALIDPRDNVTCYIGRTRSPQMRFAQHLATPQRSTGKWVKELRQSGVMPKMVVLKEVDPFDACEIERAVIAETRKLVGDRLLNHVRAKRLAAGVVNPDGSAFVGAGQ